MLIDSLDIMYLLFYIGKFKSSFTINDPVCKIRNLR